MLTLWQSNSGSACTCAATEYHYHSRDDFIIEVEWFGVDEMTAQVTDLLQSYRHFHLYSEEFEDMEEMKDCEDRARIALDTFRALHEGRLGDESFLTESSEEAALATLLSNIRFPDMHGRDGRLIQTSADECSAALIRLTSDRSGPGDNVAPWPLIKKIRSVSPSPIRNLRVQCLTYVL